MIKIFESDDEKGAKTDSAEAPFSLNISPDDELKPVEMQVEELVQKASEHVEAPRSSPENSPWEKIEGEPVHIAEELFTEPELVPEPALNVIPIEPETPVTAPEPAPVEDEKLPEPEIFTKLPYQPQTVDETIRTTGLAWNAGIIFFGSVVFMMFLGWGADLLLGSSPWGLVAGIVLGSIIGFVQFVRISSRIFRK